jgi:hypothetical protein
MTITKYLYRYYIAKYTSPTGKHYNGFGRTHLQAITECLSAITNN